VSAVHLGFLNPQGNFDANDSYWTEHPDFGGQLVYVKNVAIAMADLGHTVDILTRRIDDSEWPEFAATIDHYPGVGGVRIVRLPSGDDDRFLRKELLWPGLVRDWVPNILEFYRSEGGLPDAFTGHYGDGGLAAALLDDATGVPFTFTAHSLGAQKMDKLGADARSLKRLDEHYYFAERIAAERLAMNRAAIVVTSTRQERTEQYGHNAYAGAIDPAAEDRFAVVPPGVDLQVFDNTAQAGDDDVARHVRAALERDVGSDRVGLPAIVASSRLDPKKNHIDLVRAFARSPRLQEAANLVILTGALDDPLRTDGRAGESERAVLAVIRAEIADKGIAGKVAGFAVRGQRALAAAYRYFAAQRSLFALTALYEPFGLAPLEAAATGLPVVVTANGGPSESLRDGGTEFGVLVDPADPDDIAAGLERILLAPGAWETFAAAGRQRVLDRYTWSRTAAGYLDALTAAPEPSPKTRLPIHPFFRDPESGAEITTEELAGIYL
jgi:sucrose-phosphate synthase